MNNNFNLYCKSYRNDVLRAFELLRSIEQYNINSIPFFISTPEKDKLIFKNKLGLIGYEWVADEEIASLNKMANINDLERLPGSLTQQIIKSEFWRMGTSKAYLCLDSDSIFIKNFSLSDFQAENGNTYTIAHSSKEFFNEANKAGQNYIYKNFQRESSNIKSIFMREGEDYDFGPSPYVWHKDVWNWLSNYLKSEKNMSLWDVIGLYGTEDRWYGEALLKSRAIDFVPIKPLFKVYHYKWQYINDQKKGVNLEKLRKNYIGLISQSNWDKRLDSEYGKKKKISKIFRNIKNLFSIKKI